MFENEFLFRKNDFEVYQNTLVIVSSLNEEKGIVPTLMELDHFLVGCKLLVVDGNSTDLTVENASVLGASVIFQKGKGKGDAIRYALKYVENIFDYVVLIDADHTYPAKFLPAMIHILEKNPEIGMVCGNRFCSNLELGPMHNLLYFGNKLICFTHTVFNGVTLQDPLTGLRVIRGSILRGWQPKSAGFDIEVELNCHVQRYGYKTAEIDISYRERIGKKKLKIRDGLTIFKRIICETIFAG